MNDTTTESSRKPRATYRLQLTAEAPFSYAQGIVGYLASMGISHLYLSPFLTARPGTEHFYNVADHTSVDAVLGGIEGLRELAAAAHEAGLGLIGDVVANHMGVGPWSPVWDRLLREGRSSDVAAMFDIDWEPPLPGAAEKVILPVLDRPYGKALADGAITLVEDDDDVRIHYADLSFPLSDATLEALQRSGGVDRLAGTPGEARTWSRMHSLLEQQNYRLVSRRAGKRLVNYRRFLHVDELAALQIGTAQVFEHTHALMIDLVEDGTLDGLRIDHIEGLADPASYLRDLRARIGDEPWLIVERNGTAADPLPSEWPVDGTTGYELLRISLGLQVDPQGLGELWAGAAEHDALPDGRDVWRAKSEQLDGLLAPDLRRLARRMWEACQDEPLVRDVDYRTLLEAVTRVIVAMPVGRTYVAPTDGSISEHDREIVSSAIEAAADHVGRGNVPDALWRYLQQLLSAEVRWTAAAAEAVMRFQQVSVASLALGMEERLFFTHNAMAAACELGCDPRDVPLTLDGAHRSIAALPTAGMRTTATHDTKHSEDVRLRIAALTGMAGEWRRVSDRLLSGTAPEDTSVGLRVLQAIIGTWPVSDDGTQSLDEVLTPDLAGRLVAYAIKVARGHGGVTSHAEPDGEVEASLTSWTRGLLDPQGVSAVELRPLALRAAETAMAASLSQTLLRVAVPGVPDTYQGTERWDDSLLDPDNRRPVDHAELADALEALDAASGEQVADELWAARRDGRVKQHVLTKALRLRASLPATFGPEGTYEPLSATGRWASHVMAFRRRGADGDVVVVCPRVFGRVTDGGRLDPRGRIWADTDLLLSGGGDPQVSEEGDVPHLSDEGGWTDVLSGHHVEGGPIALSGLLRSLPVALLRADD